MISCHKFLILITYLILISSCVSSTNKNGTENENNIISPAINELTESEKSEGWELLFDGVSSKGWKGYNQESFPEKGWEIKDGNMTIKETPASEKEIIGGDIVTVEEFSNFELKLDFKLISTKANSGIFYMAQEIDDKAIFESAPEYQLLDDDSFKSENLPNKNTTASNYDLYEPDIANKVLRKNDWNEAYIKHIDGKVEHWLNGKKMLEFQMYSDDWNQKVDASKFKGWEFFAKKTIGKIGLQDHGHEVSFRNIKIKRLSN